MYTPAPDEKTAALMLYTQDGLLRGQVVVKSALSRVSTWLRTNSAPEFLHLLDVHNLSFSGGASRQSHYNELYLPIQQVIAYHLADGFSEPLDYDSSETNRLPVAVSLHVGTFLINGSLRVSSNSTVGTHLEASHSPWISLYDLSVTNPNMPGMQVKSPLALFNPSRVIIGLA